MRLDESNIDPTKLYFHGTSGKIEKLKAPSKEYEKEYKKIFAKDRDKWETLFDLITLFNEDEHSSFDKARDFIASLKSNLMMERLLRCFLPLNSILRKQLKSLAKAEMQCHLLDRDCLTR